jgi:hypothetical protein
MKAWGEWRYGSTEYYLRYEMTVSSKIHILAILLEEIYLTSTEKEAGWVPETRW